MQSDYTNLGNFINSSFDKVYLINLDIRKDRLVAADALLKKYNIIYERFPGVYLKEKYTDKINRHTGTSSLGHLGCMLSHVSCLKKSLKNNHQRVLIFEDDISFIEDNIKCIDYEQLKQDFNSLDWNFFYLGGTYQSKIFKHKKNICFTNGKILATQSIAYNKEIIEKIVSSIPLDPQFYISKLDKILPVDVMLNNIKNKVYSIYPIVCVQNDSISDIVPSSFGVNNFNDQINYWNRNK